MSEPNKAQNTHHRATHILLSLTGLFLLMFVGLTLFNHLSPVEVTRAISVEPVTQEPNAASQTAEASEPWSPTLDKNDYARRMLRLANNGLYALLSTSTQTTYDSSTGTTTIEVPAADPQALFAAHDELWPAKPTYPKEGAILPFKRIIAYYGNFYSIYMGVLGEYPKEQVKSMLQAEVDRWEAADPDTPVIPAVDYIAMVAQADAGSDGMYRRLMPDSEIEKAHQLAKEIDGILILEVQVGLSDLQSEIQRLEKWLIEPDVHLAIDPEFAMYDGYAPGTVIGVVDDEDVNRASAYLKELAIQYDLPPKVLLVHRFTQDMVQNATAIEPNEYVQVVMVMDGWGPPENKIGTYYHITEPEPVQFTGFKVFYKNDLKPPSTRLLTPEEILDLTPQPIFIQYQ